MVDVTVLGAGGATVTIALTSAQNALAAQTALIGVTKLVQADILEQQIWSGSGTLPAPQNLLGGAIISTPGNVGALSAQYVSVAVNALGNTTVVGPQNFNSTVVAGDGSNLTYGNLSSKGTVFLGDSTSTVINFAGTANVTAGTGTYVAVSGAGATTNMTVGTKSLVLASDIAGQAGGSTVINTGSGDVAVLATGSSTVPVTVNATGGNLNVTFFTGSAVINPGAANVTVAGTVGDLGGRATLFAGSGSALVADGRGSFTGGSAGGNIMFASTVAGSATLQGGGFAASGTVPGSPGDLLIGRGQQQLLIAGAGNATLFARDALSTGASTFLAGAGFSTVFGHGQGGNTYLFSGAGSALVEGRDEAAAGPAFANTYQDFAQPGGTHFVTDFVTGTDKFLASSDFTLTFFGAGDAANPFGVNATEAVTKLSLVNGTTYFFFDTNKDGMQDINTGDITKLG